MTPQNKTNLLSKLKPSLFYFVAAFAIMGGTWIGPDLPKLTQAILSLLF